MPKAVKPHLRIGNRWHPLTAAKFKQDTADELSAVGIKYRSAVRGTNAEVRNYLHEALDSCAVVFIRQGRKQAPFRVSRLTDRGGKRRTWRAELIQADDWEPAGPRSGPRET